MQKLKKVAIGVVALLIVILIGTGVAIKMIVTKDFIAQVIEDNINGRVEIGDINVPIWAALSGISIHDFKIGKKDSEMKNPMEERSPMKASVIGFKEFQFKVAVGKLITSMGKDFELKTLLLVEPKADIVLYKDGGDNLTPLLIKPSSKAENGEAPAEAAEAPADTSAPFSIKTVPTVIKMGKIGVEDGSFTVNMREYGNTVQLSDVDFLLSDIYIDPANLGDKSKNQVNMHAGFQARMDENKKDGAVQSFNMILTMDALIQPFDQKTGYLKEYLELEMRAHKGTYFTGLAAFEQLKDQTESLNKIGVSLDFLKDRIELNEDSVFTLVYDNGKVTFTTPVTIPTEDMVLKLEENSWMHTVSLKHTFTGSMILNEKYTPEVQGQVDKAVKPALELALKNIPSQLRSQAGSSVTTESVRDQILDPAINDNNEVDLGFKSSGQLASPSVSITRPSFPTPKQAAGNAFQGVKSNVTGAVSAEVDQAKAKAEAEAKAKAEAEKAKAEAAAKAEADKAKAATQDKAKKAASDAAKNLKF